MRRSLWVLAVALFLLTPVAAFGQTPKCWTDSSPFDGLPDVGTISVGNNQDVVVDVYQDSGTFVWTYYQAWIERDAGLDFVSGTYTITGGSNFPLDMDVSRPATTGFAGSGFNRSGTYLVGRLTLHTDGSGTQCADPLVDINDPYGVFCIVGAGVAYATFQGGANSGTCWNVGGGTSTEETTWGQIKGLYR
jgi:hypothetical protein